jgi:hypothetical protein
MDGPSPERRWLRQRIDRIVSELQSGRTLVNTRPIFFVHRRVHLVVRFAQSTSTEEGRQAHEDSFHGGNLQMGSHPTNSSPELPHSDLNQTQTALPNESPQTQEEIQEERRKIRRLQLMMDMVMSVIGQDMSLTVDEAAEMVADSRRAALAMFPDKELAYNLIYKPRLQRLMRERFRIQ